MIPPPPVPTDSELLARLEAASHEYDFCPDGAETFNLDRIKAARKAVIDRFITLRDELDIANAIRYAALEKIVLLNRELETAKAQRETLAGDLENALEGLEEMFGYVPEYFQNKWSHQDYIDRAQAALTRIRKGES